MQTFEVDQILTVAAFIGSLWDKDGTRCPDNKIKLCIFPLTGIGNVKCNIFFILNITLSNYVLEQFV